MSRFTLYNLTAGLAIGCFISIVAVNAFVQQLRLDVVRLQIRLDKIETTQNSR